MWVCGKEVTEWCRNKDARKRSGECARGERGKNREEGVREGNDGMV